MNPLAIVWGFMSLFWLVVGLVAVCGGFDSSFAAEDTGIICGTITVVGGGIMGAIAAPRGK